MADGSKPAPRKRARSFTGVSIAHARQLRASAIAAPVANERGYKTIAAADAATYGFARWQCRDGLLIPIRSLVGEVISYELRPDKPRSKDGKSVKYERRRGSSLYIDCHPRVANRLLDASEPLWIVEGIKKGDAAVSAGLCAVAICGVWGWQRKVEPLPEWSEIPLADRVVYIAFDSDKESNRHVSRALDELFAWLMAEGALPYVVDIPRMADGSKAGLDDYLAAGGTIDALLSRTGNEAPSWGAVVLGSYMSGDYVPPKPSILERTDGIGLLYPGKVHSLHGEPESGKSLVAQAATVRVLRSGGSVLYVDCEGDPASFAARLREFGATPDEVDERLVYVNPQTGLRRDPEKKAFESHLQRRFHLAVVDGVTDAMGLLSLRPNENDEVAEFYRQLPRRIARETGAAVLDLDHVTKDRDARGGFAIGGGHKLAALDGAGFEIDVDERFGRGLAGRAVLRLVKDRPGVLRPHARAVKRGHRAQDIGTFALSSNADGTVEAWGIHPPTASAQDPATSKADFRPTYYMERASKFLEKQAGWCVTQSVLNELGHKHGVIRQALSLLLDEGYVERREPGRNKKEYRSVRPYRQVADAASGNSTTQPTSSSAESGPNPAPARPGRTPKRTRPTSAHPSIGAEASGRVRSSRTKAATRKRKTTRGQANGDPSSGRTRIDPSTKR